MQFLRCDVATTCIGLAASMGAWLLASGSKGKRAALPNARDRLHQLIGGVMQGTATDLSIEAKEMLRLRSRMYEIMSHHGTAGRESAQGLRPQPVAGGG